MDYDIHKAVLYTMATCHSLRVVDDQLLGDPLDVKMFEFTGWAFEELAQKINTIDDEDSQNNPSSIARPPPGMEFGIDDTRESMNVSVIEMYDLPRFADCIYRIRQ